MRTEFIHYPLFALVLISPFQIVYRHKLLESLSKGVGSVDVQAEIEDAIEGVAVVAAALTSYS